MQNGKFKHQDETRNYDQFKKNLRMLLDSRGYNMTELSLALNMNTTSISRYFIDRNPDAMSLWRIADHFGVSIDWLLGRSLNRYESLSPELQKIANLYQSATENDRLVIDTLLSKYDV